MKVLFICTHNRCRSILFEAITRHRAGDVIEARSGGSQPAGEVHPLTLRHLEQRGYATEGLRSQSWDDFAEFAPDLVITVCDSAAGETCPLYLGSAPRVHWGLSDPTQLAGDEHQQAAAFEACMAEIERRVAMLRRLAEHPALQGQVLREALLAEGAQ